MIKEKLEKLGIILPNPPPPAGSYVPLVRTGNLTSVSGQIPIQEGKLIFVGKVNRDVSIEDAQKAARLCVINALAQLQEALIDLDKISRIVKLSGFVNSTETFFEQPQVINAASDLLVDIFGELGKHSRIAIGVSSLPLNSPVEIDLLVEIR